MGPRPLAVAFVAVLCALHMHAHTHVDAAALGRRCISDEILNPADVYSSTVEYDPPDRRRALGALAPGYDNIRISAFWINDTDIADPAIYNFVTTKLVPDAVSFLSQALHVVPVVGNLFVERDCQSYWGSGVNRGKCTGATVNATCGRNADATPFLQVPSAHVRGPEVCSTATSAGSCSVLGAQGPGVANTDLILYVRSKFTPSACVPGGNVIAYAAPCRKDQMDRSIVGYVNFCPDRLSADPANYEDQFATVTHEIIHVLGFSNYAFAYWRDENGQPRTPRDALGNPPTSGGAYVPSSSTVNTFIERGGTIKKLVTPAILREVRDHFGCPTLNGAEIENQGGSGSAGSHLEMRVFQSDLLTSTETPTAYMSRVLAAAFEDSGWYKVNYSMASPRFRWGKGAGCNFAMQTCLQGPKSFPTPVDANYFCSATTDGCSAEGTFTGRCRVIGNQPGIPLEMQYFSDGMVGGIMPPGDYCPMFFPRTDCRATPTSYPSRSTGQSFGAESRCVLATSAGSAAQMGLCVERRCAQYGSSGDVFLQLRLNGTGGLTPWMDCPPGQIVTDASVTVAVQCPQVDTLCYDAQPVVLAPQTASAAVSAATATPSVIPQNVPLDVADPRSVGVANSLISYLDARSTSQGLTLLSILAVTLVSTASNSATYDVTVKVTAPTGETLQYSATVTAYGSQASPSAYSVRNVVYDGPPTSGIIYTTKESTPLAKQGWFIALVAACTVVVGIVIVTVISLSVTRHKKMRVVRIAPQQPVFQQVAGPLPAAVGV